MRTLPAWLLLVGLGACRSADAAYKKDVETICDGPSLTEKKAPGFMAQMDPSQQARLIAEVVSEALETDRGKAFFRSMAVESKGPAEKASMMRAEAASVRIPKCEWADWWQKPAK